MRKYVGHTPLMSTAVCGIIFDREKGILFEKRSDNGMWCIPGGAIELGESLEEALKREIKEETGLDISEPKLFDVKASVHMIYPNKDEVYYTDVVYIIEKFSGMQSHDDESTELRWFETDRLPDNILPQNIEYLNNFLKDRKNTDSPQ